jgi:replicative DNA helicase
VQEITEITTGLKALAKELTCRSWRCRSSPVRSKQRDDKRPQLSDLRESGSIEQDADVVMFVFREEYYIEEQKPRAGTDEFIEWQAKMERAHGRAEVIIGKQRHGPVGTVELSFEAEFTRFGNLAREDQLPERPPSVGTTRSPPPRISTPASIVWGSRRMSLAWRATRSPT